MIEGSFVERVGPQSVLRLHEKIAEPFLKAGIGLVMMERRGVDGKKVDHRHFHQCNTPSQRLLDHMILVEHLNNHPPPFWNGKWILIGGSEGGPIAIKLAHKIQPLACVAIVGCGKQSFKEYIWKTIQSMPVWKRIFINLPASRMAYEERCRRMKSDPSPEKRWFGQTYRYWADALDQSEHQEFLELKCPVIVVAGSKDIECASTDQLVEMAKRNGRNVAYLRIEGMGHEALDLRWNVIERVLDWLKPISAR
jgi:pimeloyl-ACP methyl ester carboxylesterase